MYCKRKRTARKTHRMGYYRHLGLRNPLFFSFFKKGLYCSRSGYPQNKSFHLSLFSFVLSYEMPSMTMITRNHIDPCPFSHSIPAS